VDHLGSTSAAIDAGTLAAAGRQWYYPFGGPRAVQGALPTAYRFILCAALVTVTSAAQAWVQNAAANTGLVLLQWSASGSVYASYCSELGWSPCSASQAPKLTITYHAHQSRRIRG